jgi:hypothetical protein
MPLCELRTEKSCVASVYRNGRASDGGKLLAASASHQKIYFLRLKKIRKLIFVSKMDRDP